MRVQKYIWKAFALFLLFETQANAISLSEYAQKNKIYAYSVNAGKDSNLPINKKEDQTNNFSPGDAVISLSDLQLTDIKGISSLKVMYKGKKTPIKEIKKLHLFLNDNNITSIPKEITSMDNIVFLYMIKNKLEEIPVDISTMHKILGVYFTKNNITSIPEEIYNLKQLKKLEVENNKISHISEKLGNLTNLIHLNLAKNKIAELPSSIGNLQNLRVARFSNNLITKLPESFGKIRPWYHLDLSGNPITTLPYELKDMPGSINVENTKIDVDKLPKDIRSKLDTDKRVTVDMKKLPKNMQRLMAKKNAQ